MSRDKQTEIEEMRLAISEKQSRGFLEIPPESKGCSNGELAEHLIVNKGYVKATDVAEEIFAEIEELTASVYNDFMFNRDGVGMNAHYVVQFSEELDIAIAELKKKYTEEK